MAAITFGGIVSGIDSNSIIDQIVAAEKVPETALKKTQTDLNTRNSVVSDIVSRLSALATAVKGLGTSADIRAITSASSDSSRVTVAASGAATPGVHALVVSQLAQTQLDKSKTFASDTAGIAGVGSLTLAVGSDAPVTVSYDGTDTLDTIATRINAATPRESASVLFDGTSYRLLIQGRDSGAANAITYTESGSALGFNSVGANIYASLDAKFTVDGLSITRPTNIASDVLPGVTLGLQSVTPNGGAATTVSISTDPAGQIKKIQGLVDSYNAVASALSYQLGYGGVKKGADTLFGDSAAQSLQRQIEGVFASSYSYTGGSTSARMLGMSLNADGTIAFDSAAFTKALNTDPQAAEHLLLGTGTNGLGQAMTNLVDRYTNATSGVLIASETSLTKQSKAIDDQIAQIEASAQSAGDIMRAQFTAMEQAISDLKAQSSYLSSLTYYSPTYTTK